MSSVLATHDFLELFAINTYGVCLSEIEGSSIAFYRSIEHIANALTAPKREQLAFPSC